MNSPFVFPAKVRDAEASQERLWPTQPSPSSTKQGPTVKLPGFKGLVRLQSLEIERSPRSRTLEWPSAEIFITVKHDARRDRISLPCPHSAPVCNIRGFPSKGSIKLAKPKCPCGSLLTCTHSHPDPRGPAPFPLLHPRFLNLACQSIGSVAHSHAPYPLQSPDTATDQKKVKSSSICENLSLLSFFDTMQK